MTPFHFGEASSPLYGIHHAPRGDQLRSFGVLICQPIGHEYMRCHWALRRLATRLSSLGYHVMRFDYHGTGDSAGGPEQASLERWQGNIKVAAQELRDVSSVNEVALVGLRMGATLAALASADDLRSKVLVMWDPVVRGDRYVDSLHVMHGDMLNSPLWFSPQTLLRNRAGTSVRARVPWLKSKRIETDDEELLGHAFAPALQTELAAIDLSAHEPLGCKGACIVSSVNDSQTEDLERALLSGTLPTTRTVVPDVGHWEEFERVNEALLPTRIPDAIAHLLEAQ